MSYRRGPSFPTSDRAGCCNRRDASRPFGRLTAVEFPPRRGLHHRHMAPPCSRTRPSLAGCPARQHVGPSAMSRQQRFLLPQHRIGPLSSWFTCVVNGNVSVGADAWSGPAHDSPTTFDRRRCPMIRGNCDWQCDQPGPRLGPRHYHRTMRANNCLRRGSATPTE